MFEFYGEYSSGEGTDWWGLVINLLGIGFATFISWYIFNQGNKRQDSQEKNRLLELEVSIMTEIPLLCSTIDKQIAYLKQFIEVLKFKDIVPIHLNYTTALHAKAINWISRYDLFKIFIISKRGKGKRQVRIGLLSDFNNRMDYIDKLIPIITNFYENKFNIKREHFVTVWNKTILTLPKTKEQLDQEAHNATIGILPIKSEYHEKIDEIFDTYEKTENKMQPHIALKEFLLPLFKHCNNDDNKKMPFAQDFLITCTECIGAYTDYEHLKKDSSEYAAFIVEELTMAKEKLLGFKNYFESITPPADTEA